MILTWHPFYKCPLRAAHGFNWVCLKDFLNNEIYSWTISPQAYCGKLHDLKSVNGWDFIQLLVVQFCLWHWGESHIDISFPWQDCLTLNIWSPSDQSSLAAPKAVLFWIHGRCYVSGSAADAEYNATELAQKQDGAALGLSDVMASQCIANPIGLSSFFISPNLPYKKGDKVEVYRTYRYVYPIFNEEVTRCMLLTHWSVGSCQNHCNQGSHVHCPLVVSISSMKSTESINDYNNYTWMCNP